MAGVFVVLRVVPIYETGFGQQGAASSVAQHQGVPSQRRSQGEHMGANTDEAAESDDASLKRVLRSHTVGAGPAHSAFEVRHTSRTCPLQAEPNDVFCLKDLFSTRSSAGVHTEATPILQRWHRTDLVAVEGSTDVCVVTLITIKSKCCAECNLSQFQ